MSRGSEFDPCLNSEIRDHNLDYYNSETSLSVLPSGIGENWSSQDISSFDGNSVSTSAPRRSTLGLQNVTTTGSSAEYTGSYTSASLTSPNLDHHLTPVSLQKTIHGGATQTIFVLEQPEKSSRKKDKLMRSCMACFAKKQTCLNHDLNRCKHCMGEDRYCRGEIHTPPFIDLDLLNTTAADFSKNHDQAGQPSVPIRVSLKVESNNNTANILGERSFDVELQELRSVPGPSWECPILDGVLDQLFLASAPGSLQNVSTVPELETYEYLCRRFRACMSLLSNPRRCMLGSKYLHSQHTIFAVVGLLCHISCKASIIYNQIFDEIRAHCNATRDQRRTPQIMFVLTRCLGSMYKEVRCFEESLSQWNDSLFWPRSFLLNPHQTLNGIKYLGMGLSAKGFVAGQLADPLKFGAMQISLHFISYTSTVRYPMNNVAENVSVLQALSLQPRAREQPNSSTYDVAPSRGVGIFDVDSLPTEFELLTESEERAMGDFDQQGTSSASTVVEDQDALDFKNLPKDVYGTSWEYSAPLHIAHVGNNLSFATAQPPLVSLIGSVQDSLQHPATTYISPVRDQWDISDPTMPSPEYVAPNGILNEIHMSSNSNLGGDATASSQNADISLKRPTKRQRLKSLASSKKKRLTTYGHARNERSDILEKTPAAINTAYNDQASATMPTAPILSHSKFSDKEVSLQIIHTDRSAEWDRRRSRTTDLNDAIVVKDVSIPNSDRRPLSWPRRNAIRRSLDVSVEVLRSKLKNCQMAD